MRYFILIGIVFLYLFYPTSYEGVIKDSAVDVIIYWSVNFIFIIPAFFLYGSFDKQSIFISIFVFVYFLIMTVISSNTNFYSTFSIARMAPIVLFLSLSVSKINYRFSVKWMFMLFDIIIILIVLVNVFILLENEFVKEFIINNYSQFYAEATSNMFIKNRPIFTFGVYSFASYFYTLFFLLSFYSFQVTKNNKYKIYSLILLIFNILLASNSAIVSSLFMIVVLIVDALKSKAFINYVFIISFLVFIGVWINTNEKLIGYYLESTTSSANGIAGRYSKEGVLALQHEYLKKHSNIGFNIIREEDLTYTDSGYFVFRLMGGWFILIPIYYLLFRFLKNNFKEKYLLFFIITLLFETALPVLIYLKFASAMIFSVLYILSLESYKPKLKPNRII